MSIGKRIKQIRTEKEVTQEDLGRYLKVGKSTISQYETNKSTPDPNKAKQGSLYG